MSCTIATTRVWLFYGTLLLTGSFGEACVVDTPVAQFKSEHLYVSSSAGNDVHTGTSPEQAVQTLARALELLDATGATTLLLARGDEFHESLGRWTRSGSAEQPIIVGAYGTATERPRITVAPGLYTEAGDEPRFVVLQELAFIPVNRNPAEQGFSDTGPPALNWQGGGGDITVKDCLFRFAGVYFWPQGASIVQNIQFQRSLILDVYDAAGPTHGLHLDGAENVLVEDSVFDHNGWHRDVATAIPDIYSHNVWSESGGTGALLVRNSFFLRAASHGIQMRSGGVLENNIFVGNAINILVGGGPEPTPGGVDGTVVGNIVLNAVDILPRDGFAGDLPRGSGMDLENIRQAVVENNIVANCVASQCSSIRVTANTTYTNNIIWNVSQYSGYLPPSDGPFVEPSRSLESYNALLGGAPTLEAFASQLRAQSSRIAHDDYSTTAVIAYIRAGFAVP